MTWRAQWPLSVPGRSAVEQSAEQLVRRKMRYYFDTIDNGAISRDDEGLDLRSLEAVKLEVARALAGIARDVLPESDRRVLSIQVRDKAGRLVLTSELVFEVRVPDPPSDAASTAGLC